MVCVLPTGTNAAAGEAVIGGKVGVGVGEGVSVGPDGNALGEAEGDIETSGCAKGVAVIVGSGVDCARTETAPLRAAPLKSSTTSTKRSGRNVRRFSPLPPELPPMPEVFCSQR
jgi:hypothetical protein